MAIGVEQGFLVGHDSHMAFPENQIAAAQAIEIVDPQALAQLGFLHVGIARRENPAGFQRGLHKAGTIQPVRGFTAPIIGHIEKFFCHADKVCFRFIQRPDVFGENMVAVCEL